MLSFAGTKLRRWTDGDSLAGAILKNQSQTVITSTNGQDPQLQQKDIKIEQVQSRVKFYYTKGVLHSKNILLFNN